MRSSFIFLPKCTHAMNLALRPRICISFVFLTLCVFCTALTSAFAQPSIRSITPTQTSPGASIVITGIRFTGTSAVSIGGTPVAAFTIDSDTQITATVACNNASGEVVVTTSAGTARLAGFVFTPATLLITSFTPTSGPPGTVVTVTGRGLHCVTQVTVGGAAATQITTALGNQTSMSFTVPNNAITGAVTLTSSAGSASASERFTVTTPAPTITSFSPASGAAGTVITVTGTNLTGASSVSIGGVAATFTVNRDGTVSITVPSGASTGVISITTPGGTVTSGRTTFTVLPPAPTIISFSPTSAAPGATISIMGANFTGANSVTVGGVAASSFTIVSPTTITFVIPNGAQSGVISITTPGGTATSGRTTFTVLPPAPTITNFSPTTARSGSTVTIQGTNLIGASSVTVGGVPAASFVIVSPTTITFVVPSNAGNGVITVTTPGGRASSASVLIVNPASVRIAEEHAMRIFPQPASDRTTLEYTLSEASSVSIEIVNTLGKAVFSPPVSQFGSGLQRVTLPTEGLGQGAYFVRVHIGGKVATVPLQVVR
jgi:hypothetical protein